MRPLCVCVGGGAQKRSEQRLPAHASSPGPTTAGSCCLMSDRLVFCFTGTDNLQINVTPNPESFPPGKLSLISPTWPFSEVQSSSAVDRIKDVLGPTPDNTSVLQSTQTPPPKTHRRPRAHGDLSASPYQGSGYSASLEPSKDSTKALVQPRPQGGREAAGVSGLPHTSMLPALPAVPSGTSLSPVLPSQPVGVGTPSISERHSLRSDSLPLLPPSPSPSLFPDSPHSIIFSKPAGRPTTAPLVPQTAASDSSPSQSVVNPLHPLTAERNHTPSPNAQDFISIPRLSFSGSSAKQYSEPSPTEDPRAAGSPTPEFLRSLAHPSPPPLALGSLHLPRGTPSWSSLEAVSRPASTQPITAEVAKTVHTGVSQPALKRGAVPSHFQTVESGVVGMTSRTLAAATAKDSANPLHLSAAPENSEGPVLSAEHTSSSLVPSPLPPTTTLLSGAVPASPLKGAVADSRTVLQPAGNPASPSTRPRMPAPQGEGHDGPPPTAATDFLLSSTLPNLATTWIFPLQREDGVTAVLRKNERANLTVALQTLLSKEIPRLHTPNGLTSAFSTDPISPTVRTTPRANVASELPPRSLPSTQAAQTVSPSPAFSSSKPGTDAAATGHSELPVSASKQVTAFPASTAAYDFSTMGSVKKPAVTDVFWSSLSTETGSLSTEPAISGLLQQTNYAINGHTINSTSWKPRSASSPAPSVLASAVNTIDSQDLRDTAGHVASAEGFSIQDSVLDTGTKQPIQQSDVTVVGKHTAVSSTSDNNHSRDFQATEIEDDPSISEPVKSHPHVQQPVHSTWLLSLPSPSLPATAGLQEMFSDGMDTSSQLSSNFYPSPVGLAPTPFQSIPRYHSTAEASLSTRASLGTPSKVLPPSQRPKKWTGAATNAGSLFPGTQKTGMTAPMAKASSSSTQILSFAQEQTHPSALMKDSAAPNSHVLDPLLTWCF